MSSVKRRAGTVVDPSSSIMAGTHRLIPISRSVAERRRRPSSVASRILLVIGRVLRALEATPLPTMPRPRLNCSCCTDTFMAYLNSESVDDLW
jgi:hypothetical protein